MLLLTVSYRCSRQDLARKHFGQAVNWIPQVADPQTKLSKDFDYKSIMI
jgi:hypothetical protein